MLQTNNQGFLHLPVAAGALNQAQNGIKSWNSQSLNQTMGHNQMSQKNKERYIGRDQLGQKYYVNQQSNLNSSAMSTGNPQAMNSVDMM